MTLLVTDITKLKKKIRESSYFYDDDFGGDDVISLEVLFNILDIAMDEPILEGLKND